MTFAKCWCNIEQDAHKHSTKQYLESMNYVFVNCSEDNEIHLLLSKRLHKSNRKINRLENHSSLLGKEWRDKICEGINQQQLGRPQKLIGIVKEIG
jgi:hypothetical protein